MHNTEIQTKLPEQLCCEFLNTFPIYCTLWSNKISVKKISNEITAITDCNLPG